MAAKNPTGKAILQASLQLFRQDRQMIWLPVMATVTAVIAFGAVAGPLVLALGYTGYALVLAMACGSVVATAATVIFNVALVFAATDRIEGRTPSIASSMAQAWARRGVIFQWALLSAVVGTAIRLLEERLGLVGRLLGLAGGLAWVVATYLVIPVLAFENLGPIDAVKRSSSILKARFGTVARSGLRFGAIFLGLTIAAMLVLVAGVALIVGRDVHHRGTGGDRRVRGADRHRHVRAGGRDVHAHDPLPLRHRASDSRPGRRRRGRIPLLVTAGVSARPPAFAGALTRAADPNKVGVAEALGLAGDSDPPVTGRMDAGGGMDA